MKVVMLVQNDVRADARVDREASALAAAGHDVVVLALRASGVPEAESRDGFTVRRVADYTTAGWSLPWRKVSQARARASRLVSAAVETRPDVVHAHDSDTLLAAVRISEARGCPFIYDAHELYPDMLQEHGLQGTVLVQAYWRHVERRSVRRSAAVITVSDGLAGELRRRYGVDPVVVANVPPLQPLGDCARLRRELDLDSCSPVVLYQGVLTRGRGLERLVRAMAQVPGAVLVVQGFGPAEDAMRKTARMVGIADRVRFMGRIAPSELQEYASGADVGVVIYEHTTLNNYLAAPNKLYAYLMAGLPVVSSNFPGLSAVVEGDDVGVTFDPASEESIGAALRSLLSDVGRLDRRASNARRLAETRYNWDVEKLKLLDLYDRLAARSTS